VGEGGLLLLLLLVLLAGLARFCCSRLPPCKPHVLPCCCVSSAPACSHPRCVHRAHVLYCLYFLQLFIFYTIQQYGALHFALIMTMRQFLSIVLSCLIFSHDLAATQW
jgi:hypothetical protein